MDSSLRPREIQTRIRSGESLEDVARAAGVPPEQIAGFAAPVIAEREHIAALAQAAPVRRAGETVAHRILRTVVDERLLADGVDSDAVTWDAWRVGDRRWWIKLDYDHGGAHHEAVFTFDQTGRFSVASNDDARRLVSERSPEHAPQPGRRRRVDNPDEELTIDLNDQFAIVRAIQPVSEDDEDVVGPDNEDAYAEAELEEVDGVYDFVPAERANMDVLYDMLSSFDEDSVQIYAGLVRSAPHAKAAVPVLDEGPEASAEPTAPEPEPETEPVGEAEESYTEASAVAEEAAVEAAAEQFEAPAVLEEAEAPGVPEITEAASVAQGPHAAADEPPAAPADALRPSTTVKPSADPEQPRLVDEGEGPNEPTRPIRRKRATVPSWDEIMFGSPTTPKRP